MRGSSKRHRHSRAAVPHLVAAAAAGAMAGTDCAERRQRRRGHLRPVDGRDLPAARQRMVPAAQGTDRSVLPRADARRRSTWRAVDSPQAGTGEPVPWRFENCTTWRRLRRPGRAEPAAREPNPRGSCHGAEPRTPTCPRRHRQRRRHRGSYRRPLARLADAAAAAAAEVLALAAPVDCVCCGAEDLALCGGCERQVRLLMRTPFRAEAQAPALMDVDGSVLLPVVAAGAYRAELAQSLLSFKKHGQGQLARGVVDGPGPGHQGGRRGGPGGAARAGANEWQRLSAEGIQSRPCAARQARTTPRAGSRAAIRSVHRPRPPQDGAAGRQGDSRARSRGAGAG